jgi:hypothetical protein
MRVGQIVKQYAENDINREKLQALDPVAFAVRTDLLNDQDRAERRLESG